MFCLIDICDHRESNSIVVEKNYYSLKIGERFVAKDTIKA